MKTLLRSLLAALVLSAPLAACTAPVETAEEGVAAKETALTAIDAKFARWLPTPNGKIAGMVLDNGSIVNLHPEAIADASSLKAGDAVRVEGVQKEGVFKFASVSKDGNVVAKAPELERLLRSGETKHHGKKLGHHKNKGEWKHGDKAAFAEKIEKMKAKHAQELASLGDVTGTGTIETVLPGRHGSVHGFILSDGTVAYLPHHSGLGDLELKKGDAITVSGKGGSYEIGKSMIIQSVTLPSGEVKKA